MTCLSGMAAEDDWQYIETGSLASLLKTGLDKVLLIDSRSFLEYNTSRIQHSVNVCCSKLAKRRLQQDKITVRDLLDQSCHIDMEEYSDIVVYDQCTADLSVLTEDNFLVILLRKLRCHPGFNQVALLKGGYLSFQAMQPHFCESKSDSNYNCTALTFLSQPCLPVSNVGPTRILPFLYLGSHRDAISQETIQVNDISYILNVSTTCPRPPHVQEGHFFRIPINDNYSAKMLPFFEEAFQFIDKVREANGCVLVHCLAGISRSPTLAIAYIMKHLCMSSDDAYRYVKDKRPTISPNFNFLGQLLEFEKKMKHERDGQKQRQDGVSSDHKPTSIIAMDLQMCSPSSPKISKPFTFDSLWDSYSLSSSSNESTKTLPLLRDSDTWADFPSLDTSLELSRKIDDFHSNEENNNMLGRKKTMEKSKPIPAWPAPCQNIASTPCEENKTFPFTTIPSENDISLRLSSSPKSPGNLSTSPKSPGKRSFTLPLSPVPLSTETKEKSFPRSFQTVSYERVRLKSPRQSFNRPFSLPLSPVISPGDENLSDNSDNSPMTSKNSAISGNCIKTSVHCSVSMSTTPVSRRSFSLALSSSLMTAEKEVSEKKETALLNHSQTVQCHGKDLVTLSSNLRSNENTSSKTFVSNAFQKDLLSNVHSSDTLTSTSQLGTSISEPDTMKKTEFQTFCSNTTESFSFKSSACGKLSEIDSSLETSGNKKDEHLDNILSDKRPETRPTSLKMSLCGTDIISPSPVKRPSFSLALSTVITNENTESSKSNALSSQITTQSVYRTNIKLSMESSHLECSEHKNVINLAEENDESMQTLKPCVPKSLAIHNSVVPNKKLCISQSMSPSSAMARLNFSQTLSETKPRESVGLHNYPSTSLDKLNFTPCFSNNSTKCIRKIIPDSNSTDSQNMKVETMVISPDDTLSPVSSSGSSSTGTITSPTSNCKVIRRSHENRAKRPMERPNSIAFSKYPTFDLGSDCQDSPSSGSSTSQDDASEMYILQNGKRSKFSDTKLRIGHFSEKEVYKQISAAMESAMLRTKVYEANRKARSLDDMLSPDESDSPNHCSPFNRLPSHCIMGNDRYSSPIYDGCRPSSDPYQSNSSISSNGSHGSLQGSLEIIQDPEYMVYQ